MICSPPIGTYVYQRSEPGLYTVGFYKPNKDGAPQWEPESDHTDREAAAARVSYLNGETRCTT